MLSTDCSPLDGGDLPSHENACSSDLFSSFSIRDYVHSVRSKNISRSWPFSLKNLELCLKHGVINPLPPFQSPYSLKSGHFHQHTTAKNNSSFRSKPPLCGSPLKVIPEIPKPVAIDSQSGAVGSSSVVESEPKPNPKPETEILLMASNACPVCETFASPSNTTLNAHIDQCLSKVGTSKWPSESNPNKRRVRPRKIRLMVDIYATASHCTLEELDRRNGTNWAIVDRPISHLRDPLNILCNEGEKQGTLSDEDGDYCRGDNKDCEDSRAVYRDSSGTKLRILSRFNEKPSGLIVGTKNHPSNSMKRVDFQNHHRFLKFPQRKETDPPNACKFKVHIPQQQNPREKNNQRTNKKASLSMKSFGKDLLRSFDEGFIAHRSFVQKSSDFSEKLSSPGSNIRKRSWCPFTSEEINDLIGSPSDSSMVKKFDEPTIVKKLPKFSSLNQREVMKLKRVSSNDLDDDSSSSLSSRSLCLEEEIAISGSENSQPPEIITEDPCSGAMSLNSISRLISPLKGPKDLNFDELFFGEDEFPEVERILIPGPPGSFLPSPRAMSSEDLKPNSSLTTSRVLSSIDGAGASSATSTISNPSPRLLNLNSPGADFSRTPPSPLISLDYMEKSNVIMEKNYTIEYPKNTSSSPILRLMGKDLMVGNKESVPSLSDNENLGANSRGFDPSMQSFDYGFSKGFGIREGDGLGRSLIWNGFGGC